MTTPPSSRAECAARLVGAVALTLIAGALGFQYLAHIAPCEMCHWQRWPHIAAAIIAFVILPQWKSRAHTLAATVIALVAISGLIGLYQTGMQIGLLPGPQACTGARFVLGSNVVPDVQCNVVTWSLFGLSLASYNALVSLSAAAAGLFVLVRK